jgi:hypothetical protein
MSVGRRAVVGILVTVSFSLVASGIFADTAALYLPPDEAPGIHGQVMLAADRSFGFAPMLVSLSGMLRQQNGNLLPMNGGQQIRVIVESPFLRVQNSSSVSPLMSALHYEAVSPGPSTPSAFRRVLEIRRPGTYSFRVQVVAPDGQVLNSNEVNVRVL